MTQHPPGDRAGHQPRYRGGDENANDAREPLTPQRRRTRVLVIAVVIAVLVAFVILHITGTLGPGTNG
jgi:hypothetical protein